jgi:5'(3')-deoxyribonucleotidase
VSDKRPNNIIASINPELRERMSIAMALDTRTSVKDFVTAAIKAYIKPYDDEIDAVLADPARLRRMDIPYQTSSLKARMNA